MTRSFPLSFLVAIPLSIPLSGLATAQSNTVPGRDLMLIDTWNLQQYQRAGVYPTGQGAMGAYTTVCNAGTAPIPFVPPMSPDHCFIAYMICRESGVRFEQISNWCYVKHTVGSSNLPSSCGNCAGTGNQNQVEVGCSDTYANTEAVDNYLLGPPEEVDPWLGAWDPQCSHFDRGEPEVSPLELCDRIRSLDEAQASALNLTVNHQLLVHDADLAVLGAAFWLQCGYICPGEAEANRADNLGSRGFLPAWDGTHWVIADGPDFLNGTVLQRWSGALITSGANGSDDGRFYVAMKVFGPTGGLYHYEFAIHDRDNKRGLAAFRVPVCPAARVQGFGFRDLDQDGNNDWSASRSASEITFQTTTNPLRWNMIFNFWFDSDAAPESGNALYLDQYDLGPGALTLTLPGSAPTGLYDETLGPGCGVPAPPTLYAIGTVARATLGNATFALASGGNPPGALCGFVAILAGGTTVLDTGCTLYAASATSVAGPFPAVADRAGVATMPLPVPNEPALEGMHADFQAANSSPPGALFGQFNLSSGLRVHIGSVTAGCQ